VTCVEDTESSGRTSTNKTDENVDRVKKAVARRITIYEVANT